MVVERRKWGQSSRAANGMTNTAIRKKECLQSIDWLELQLFHHDPLEVNVLPPGSHFPEYWKQRLNILKWCERYLAAWILSGMPPPSVRDIAQWLASRGVKTSCYRIPTGSYIHTLLSTEGVYQSGIWSSPNRRFLVAANLSDSVLEVLYQHAPEYKKRVEEIRAATLVSKRVVESAKLTHAKSKSFITSKTNPRLQESTDDSRS